MPKLLQVELYAWGGIGDETRLRSCVSPSAYRLAA